MAPLELKNSNLVVDHIGVSYASPEVPDGVNFFPGETLVAKDPAWSSLWRTVR